MSTSSNAADRIALMQTFVRIVEAGSLSAAATQLGTTQPTISRRLQALERMLGLRLLQRSTHAMQLTEDGERCLAHARELLSHWSALASDVQDAREEPAGLLRVVVPHAFGQQQMIGALSDFLRRHPRVSIEWLLHDRAPDFIGENIDCAIRVGEVSDPSVIAIKLADVPRIAVAAPSLLAGQPLPTHPEQLAALPWLSLRTFYRNEIVLHHASGASHKLALQPRMSSDGLFAVRNAAVQGMGVCVISSWALREELAQGTLVHLAPAWQATPLPMYIVYPHAPHYPARLRRFIDAMRAAMPAILSDL
ncbi:DNA-binding transcriptional LysR family regulator [Duganella sp. 1224]|uniref:LysR family transcriptional regulator n=1 Tax=Duganella sp. 1224 TaxID=2587052 RepID=UPI001839364E|nr:LysR family transcriptional regulator [Duganella sp. 1224]NYE62360.1 DNA-binding transcriptional LysR family regulator [Duganella sp. 1224]